MSEIFDYLTPITYWLLIAIWSWIVWFYYVHRKQYRELSTPLAVMLLVLGIDAFRTLFESLFFGAWFTSRVGIIPSPVYDFLVKPEIVFIPKFINLIVAGVIVALLIRRLIPAVIEEGKQQAKTIDRLTKSERSLEESQGLAHMGQWDLDLVRNTLFWTDEVYRIFEIDKERFDASYEAFLNAIHPEDRARVNQAYERALAEKTSYEIDHRLLMDDGRIKFVREQCRNEYDENGDPVRSIGTIQDITDLVERDEALREANERLRELDKLKTMFIASMSHELRTPLNSVIGFSGSMLKGIHGEPNKKQRDYLERINKAGRHLLALITDVIDISKIEAARVDVVVSSFTLDELINDAILLAGPEAAKKNLAIETKFPADLEITTDRRRLMQCLLNYLDNAVKYSEEGRIIVSVEERDDRVRFEVADNGIGISKDDQRHVFEAFERFDTHLSVRAGGTGLGLYLTHKIVSDILLGVVGFDSREGEGSRFWLEIPISLKHENQRAEVNFNCI